MRFLGSWLSDLKEGDFTDSERWQIIKAIANSQLSGNTGYLRELPREIKRGLSISTLIEQNEYIIEKVNKQRERGRLGGIAKRDAYDINANVRKYEEPRGTMSILDWEKIKGDLNK